ncbi:neural cell adhesion molecule L1.2 isoform X2 [Eucyclogobius newberryi]|uniref:neural cell adhesion molecule L1.2 isoform X2 n=1 Tax=Eucyclogobius newberryi TaxID=166745 RepID=UPI003B5942A7
MPHTQRQQVGSRGQCLSRLPHLFLLLLALRGQPIRAAIHIPSTYHISDLKKPPTITTQPESVTVFSVEDFVMTCEASGNPAPIFRWTKNGEEFDPGVDPDLKVTESGGSFAFYTLSNTMDSLKPYQAKYVCLASNELGTALSNEATLSIDAPPTQQKEKKVNLKAEEGNSIVLKCNPPHSAMEPIIHWMDWRLLHIALSERVMLGTDGNLYFAHVTAEDSRNDYTCNVQYLATRTILAKEPITLTVTPSNAVVRSRRPHMMRPTGTHSSYLALRGQSLVLECLVQGYPTPKVKWLRKDGDLSESRTAIEMFDRRFRFTNISESDNGEYQCIAENTQGKIVHTFTVSVEAAPYWIKEPLSQLYAPGETVKLDCQADGIPTPTINWTINGTPLSAIDKDPRRVSAGGSLTLMDVQYGDTAIYQCQASNKHGNVLTNTNVYVIELEPQILTKDSVSYEFVEGQKASLDCDTFGSPKPKVTWEGESTSSLLSDPRVNQLTNGGLEILNVTHDDEGLYTCSVENTNMSVSAQLDILNRTVVTSPLHNLKVQPGHSATFSCVSSVDPKLSPPLIQWRKNEQKIFESHSDDRYTFEGSDLIISNVQQVDEGVYTCQVITDLDMAEASGTLTLYDRPDPPTHLQITHTKDPFVTLSWTAGDEHNSPVIEYIVEFEDQEEKGEWEEMKRVGGTKQNTRVLLWPYMSYRFRVSAVNEVGRSAPSKPSDSYDTLAEGPHKNPEDVRSDSTDPDTLVITWEEMDKRDFNGPDFRYRVMWRRVVGSGPNWNTNYTTSPPLILHDIGNFSAFEIKVQAVNKEGEGPEPDPVIGYSGENVPLEAPVVVGVALVNSTAIRVTWAPVEKNTVRGHLLGYKIHLTWKGSRAHHHSRRSREPEATWVVETGANEEKKVINDLRPYSHYELAATVFNSKGEGPPSETLSFSTDEGVPGPPKSLTLDSPSETEMTLRWTPPEEPNGVLKGYLLQYHRIVKSDDSPMLVEAIDDPTVTHLTLKNLDRHSHYRFYLRGCTSAGDGESIKKDGATTLEGAPPVNISVSVGESSANFSWVAKKRHRSVSFHIEYLNKNDGSEWKKVEKVDSSLPFYQLQGLTPGSHYRMRLSFNNNTFWESDLDTEGTAMLEKKPHFPTEGWFIGLVSALALLLLILLILCFIKRSKGGKYSVKDKEDGPLDSEARPMKDETFGEYSDLEEKRTASQASLCEESKLCSQDYLDFNGSSAITTELNLDESLGSQFSRPSDAPDTNLQPTNDSLNNAVTILD